MTLQDIEGPDLTLHALTHSRGIAASGRDIDLQRLYPGLALIPWAVLEHSMFERFVRPAACLKAVTALHLLKQKTTVADMLHAFRLLSTSCSIGLMCQHLT